VPEPLKASVQRAAEGWHWAAERPEQAMDLEVGYRPAGKPPARRKARPVDLADARKAYAEADAALAFANLPSPARGQRWEGTVDRPGWLRLVATGGRKLYAVVLKLQ
jgi:hypothetical protein